VNAPTTAVTRLRLLRRRQTALYALAAAVCLVVPAGVAGVVDAHSRASALDAEVDRSATALSRAVYYDQGTLHLEPLRDDVLAAGPTSVYVMEWGANGALVPRYGSARDTWLPTPDTLREVADETSRDQETVLLDGTANDGRPLRLAGAPVWNGGQVSATVIAASDPADGNADHAALLRELTLVCLILLVAATAAGHLLSGRGMRAALRVLDQQERFLAEAADELRSSRPVDEMGRSVTDLLSRARLAAGTQPAEREPLRLDLLVEQLVENLDTAAEISVMASPCVVSGDPELLSQAATCSATPSATAPDRRSKSSSARAGSR